ncbi:YcxB family protein [Flaviaesturariibacter aridisoli]|uniref:YcxB family protein n=1 Tax=Flaviaesturariibacter aridisoli TaxID=2545761 RepID=A0A4R4E5G1_9BACT|nr:YcxB family protein [Flaviaesturariibacter aridisoli]TCZ74874.1 YcxB family protein [Flaviaesturariibacter aridisoli]
MKIPIQYERKAVIQALRYHFLSRREIRLMIILVNVFALASAVLFYMHKILPLAFLLGSFLWFSLMLVFWWVLPLLVYRRNETFQDHFTMEFFDDGFRLGNERGERFFPWKRLSTYTETPGFLYFYFDPRSFFLVPTKGFATADDLQEIRMLLRQQVGKK